jgi:hypothetical protein
MVRTEISGADHANGRSWREAALGLMQPNSAHFVQQHVFRFGECGSPRFRIFQLRYCAEKEARSAAIHPAHPSSADSREESGSEANFDLHQFGDRTTALCFCCN